MLVYEHSSVHKRLHEILMFIHSLQMLCKYVYCDVFTVVDIHAVFLLKLSRDILRI